MFTQGGEDRGGGSDQLQKVKDRDGAQGRREETRKIQTKGHARTRQQPQRAENEGGGGHQRGEGRTVGRSKGDRVGSARADDGESNCGIRRMLLAENRG
jgi:hypothetical protein